ncbi:MAG: NAD-dependent epimerase/dehydratase family protein [Candidatus ainarchaeum sp.]|nr:NAD-dependent epimerase/dehydratase family protein [Candidatus ainarchaeum sp.]
MFSGKSVVVTGGAGFIGSHVVDELLLQGANVLVLDSMRTGQPKIVEAHKKAKNYSFQKLDLLKKDALIKACAGAEFIFHLAANADIRGGMANTSIDLEQNTIATHNVLEAMRLNDIKGIAFSSSGAVYGIQKAFPVPEDAPMIQNSLYGASKLAGEALIEAYSEYYGIANSIYRFVSIVGERYPHGVVIDFYRKLKKNPRRLEILGDGKQKKSYLYVKDCVAGMMAGARAAKAGATSIYNLGQGYTIGVDTVADMIVQEMRLNDVEYRHTGGAGGWVGDQPVVLLSTKRMEALGWKPKVSIEDGVRRTIRYLIETNSP